MKTTSLLTWLCVVGSSLCLSASAQGAKDNFMVISGGPFTMGDSFGNEAGCPDELPLHQLDVGTFYMEATEVTSEQWSEVRTWAYSNGYHNLYSGYGKPGNHPVATVEWYHAVEWCNARSEMNGFAPCYYTDSSQTTVYRGDYDNIYPRFSNNCVNWRANGYRLPTEAEWEKAARGGGGGHRFAWSKFDTISHTNANYYSNHDFAWDISLTPRWHPMFYNVVPYTSPVGYFAPNDSGLYDMTGNLWEWCWDWYSSSWYSDCGAETHGPSSGTSHVIRGGSWNSTEGNCRVARRSTQWGDGNCEVGFRCVRSSIDSGWRTGGQADFAMVDPTGGWTFWFSSGGYLPSGPYVMSVPGGEPVAGDFDGDRLADPAMVANGGWTFWFTSGGYLPSGPYVMSVPGGKPVASDFDGDLIADPAMVANGGWTFWFSSGGYLPSGPYVMSVPGGVPVAGDFDGDGFADPVMVANGGWTFWFSSGGYLPSGPYIMSVPGGKPVAADFDGQ